MPKHPTGRITVHAKGFIPVRDHAKGFIPNDSSHAKGFIPHTQGRISGRPIESKDKAGGVMNRHD